MFTKTNKCLAMLLALMVVAMVWLIGQNEKNKDKIQTLGAENIALVSETERLRSLLDDTRKSAAREAAELTEMLGTFSELLGHRELSTAQLQKVIEIVDTTPMQMDAAAALVYYSDYFDVDCALVLSIVEIESNFQQYLVGSSNDRGFMQIIPITERHLADSFGHQIGVEYDPSRIFEPDYNLGLGISYIAYLMSIHGDDLDKILTEYNKGAEGLAAYYAEHSTYSSVYSRSVIDRSYKYENLGADQGD